MVVRHGVSMETTVAAQVRYQDRKPAKRVQGRYANLWRLARSVVSYIAQYKDTYDGDGNIIASKYLGHKVIYS